jgi:hypothetical protein
VTSHLNPVPVVTRIERATVDLPRCQYCGWPCLPGNGTCFAHSDLPELEWQTLLRRRLAPSYTFPDAA